MDRLSYTIVAVLDLGTTNSGYAFASTSELPSDKLKVHENENWSPRMGWNYINKTPSCIILGRDKEFKEFGYDAEDSFVQLCMEEKQDEYYFFKGFYTKKNFSDTMLIDETGKSLPASHVFTLFIKAFVNYVTIQLCRSYLFDFGKGDIRWVIPVVANLSDTDKHFLRSCAGKAGILSDQLMFVTKAEAAFIYWHHLLVTHQDQQLKDGTECMIVHLGGSVADITVLKKDDNQVIEKYRITGNDCGGTSLDDRFLSFLVEIFGSPIMTSLRRETPSDFLDIVRAFASKKRSVKGNSRGKIVMKVPYETLESFCQKYYGENLADTFASSPYAPVISMMGDKMRIDSNIFHSLFKPSIDGIMNLMEKVFTDYTEAHNVKAIVMVGGFSECSLVQDAVRQKFSNVPIVIPENPEITVMKGAVLCGFQPCQYLQISSSELQGSPLMKIERWRNFHHHKPCLLCTVKCDRKYFIPPYKEW